MEHLVAGGMALPTSGACLEAVGGDKPSGKILVDLGWGAPPESRTPVGDLSSTASVRCT